MEFNKPKLILVRGISGSGKTYKSHQICNDLTRTGLRVFLIEADMFFMNDNKEYNYRPSLIKYAHQWCLSNTIRQLTLYGTNVVIVSNTFTKLWELESYIKFVKEYDFDLEVVESDSTWRHNPEECFKRNTHNVPFDVIKKQMNGWEKYE